MTRSRSRWHKPGWRFLRRLLLWPLLLVLSYWAATLLVYRWILPPVTPLMLIRSIDQGNWIDYRRQSLPRISPHLVKAVIASEDSRFCQHHGIDLNAVSDAIEDYSTRGRLRGASTITMQVSRNVFLWNGGGIVRKVLEVPLALLLDALWPKQRTIELYLNIAEWGDGTFGAEAAARRYFNKPARQLTPAEAAQLAAILPNPIRWSAARPTRYIQARSKIIHRRMAQLGRAQLDCLATRP
jgi:monofunctional biosynthetic peptidoglycan transglycosylase